MKICWDNLEKLKYNKNKKIWYDKYYNFYVYKKSCKTCGDEFLSLKNKEGKFCNIFCSNNNDETKEKISISMNGENHWNWCKKLSEKTKNKISKSEKGKIISEKSKQKQSISVSGEYNPNWKGGISYEPYCSLWVDKEFKEAIKERDGYQCLNPTCSRQSKEFCIHHINYVKKDCSPFNLITVCKSCNVKANFDREWHTAWYNAIIYQRYRYGK